jgi:hypothetical protein
MTDSLPSSSKCARWGSAGHNWMGFPVRGWLPGRYYRVCCGCGYQERTEKGWRT